MKTEVFLNLEGRRYFVGVLSSDQNDTVFQYADDFLNTRLEISPISVPGTATAVMHNCGK